ncbi:siroheme synthase CysG [Symbiopectobacterium purcellii]|uniref:siroheme synthase CysG n=1 Tax=Symbiopectobacterium purcellii TaxID=2871826 RepID=UPI003F8350B7
MNYLPLFADVKQRVVLVVGGGEVATRKIDLLLRAGADVHVVAKSLAEPLLAKHNAGQLHWLAQAFSPEQVDKAFLVIAATDDVALNAAVSQAAQQRYRLVNVVDDQPKCSFIFPSIVDRSPLVVAISSGGQAPVLARLLREKLEALLPASLGDMARVAGEWRDRVKERFHSMRARRQFWERLFNSPFADQIAAGQQAVAEETLRQQLDQPQQVPGDVALVGAGPGDAGLLTLRGLQLIQLADVVLYDHLVSPEVLELVRRDAEKICVGKRASAHSLPQGEINRLLFTLASSGKRVVRLKGGDPFIFGRGGEEVQYLAKAGIPFQIVPGITAAAGVTAYAGIPLTHRDYAQSVLFITGHCRPDGEALDWSTLARGRQTLAIYMGTVKAAEISQQLIAHGRAPDTPVAVISRGTRADQSVNIGTLAQLEALAHQAPTPALLVIGEVVALHHQLDWFGLQAQETGQTGRSALVNLA